MKKVKLWVLLLICFLIFKNSVFAGCGGGTWKGYNAYTYIARTQAQADSCTGCGCVDDPDMGVYCDGLNNECCDTSSTQASEDCSGLSFDECTTPEWTCDNDVVCSWCSPSCSPACGQSDGCGGTCGTGSVNWPDPLCVPDCGDSTGHWAYDTGCGLAHWCAPNASCCEPGTDWSPATDTVCLGVSFTQTESTCSTTRTATGTKTQAQTCTSSEIQFIETPQHTGSIWAKMYGVTADASTTYFPTWSSYGGQNDLQWYTGTKDVSGCTSNCTWTTTINVSNHPVTSAERWVDTDGYISGCRVTTNPCTISGFTITDKTCSVGVTKTGDRSFRVTVSADGSLNPGSQRARLFVERQDTSQVLNYTTAIIPATTEVHNPGAPYYYNFACSHLSAQV